MVKILFYTLNENGESVVGLEKEAMTRKNAEEYLAKHEQSIADDPLVYKVEIEDE